MSQPLFLLLLNFITFHPQPVQAITVGNLPVDVELIYPPDQAANSRSFFNIALNSGNQVSLGLQLNNLSDQPQAITIQPISATTDYSGAISYQLNDLPPDSSLTLSFPKVTSKKQTVKLTGKTQKTIYFTVKIPKDTSFNGSILGAFYLHSPTNDQQNLRRQSKSKIQISNLYALSIGTWLRVNDYQAVQPDFRLGDVTTSIQGISPVLITRLQNFHPAIIQNGGLNLKARVYHRDSSKVLLSKSFPHASFSPNSTMYLPIPFSLNKLAAGNYTLKIDLKYQTKTWRLQRNFTITADQANKLSQALHPKQKSYRWFWILLITVLLMFNFIFTGYLYRRGRFGAKSRKKVERHH